MNKTKLAVAVLGLALAGVASAATVTYNGTPFAINDTSTSQGTLAVPAGDWGRRDTVRDVDCAVRLRHTWDSDLAVELKGPSAATVVLWANQGGASDNFNVIIDDPSILARKKDGVLLIVPVSVLRQIDRFSERRQSKLPSLRSR